MLLVSENLLPIRCQLLLGVSNSGCASQNNREFYEGVRLTKIALASAFLTGLI